MDWIGIRGNITRTVKKYRYALLVLVLGLFLMLLPRDTGTSGTALSETEPEAMQEAVEERLCAILSQIDGVGKVDVLLTESAGAQTIYQTDENSSGSDTSNTLRRETVIVSNADREENGLVQQVIPPEYLGAVVVCQGAESASVKLAVVEAVSNAVGLSADRITVLKMK